METVVNIIKELERTSSTNSKVNIIKKHAEHEGLTKVFKYAYSSDLQYGFSEKKLREIMSEEILMTGETWSDGFEMLDELAVSNINDSLRRKVTLFLQAQPEDVRELFIRILTKDLRCNISSKLINKAIKGLIKTWDIQQAYPINKAKLKKGEWIALSLKLNGIRSSFLGDEFRSRQDKVMNGLDHVKHDLELLGISHMFVDGEMVRKNIDNISDNENFRLTTSILGADDSDKTQIKFVIFDIITRDDFIAGESELKFKERLEILESIREDIERLGLQHVDVAPIYYTGTDHSMIDVILEKVDLEGLEGLMCLRNMPYKTKRHNGILKCKVFETCDLRIIGFEEGTGKLKGSLGSIICDYKGNSLGVGSGYSDSQRSEIWINKDNLLGKIVEVKYKEESMDKDTKMLSLQFPTFKGFRFDKDEPSYN